MEKQFIEHICRIYPVTITVQELVSSVQEIFKQQEYTKFDEWLAKVDQSGIVELKGFANALRREMNAVISALKYPLSTSQVEGHINKLKMVKSQMFGRAKLDLLKARVLNYGRVGF